jgi:hypothetical protein
MRGFSSGAKAPGPLQDFFVQRIFGVAEVSDGTDFHQYSRKPYDLFEYTYKGEIHNQKNKQYQQSKNNKRNLYTQRTCRNRSPGSTNNVFLKIFGWHQARFPQRMMAIISIKLKIKK